MSIVSDKGRGNQPKIILGHPFPEKKCLVVITGCDTGFGRLLSEQLASCTQEQHRDRIDGTINNSRMIIVSLCLTAKAVEELRTLNRCKNHDTIHAIQCDITKDIDVQRATKEIEALLNEKKAILHTLVNNAGIVNAGNFLFYNTIEPYQRVMDVNFFGMLRVTQALLPLFLRSSFVYGGRIINISSVAGASASSGNSTYDASKFAIEGWSDSLRVELAEHPFNIKVVKVRPGPFGTTIHSDWKKTFESNFMHASRQIRDLYGGKAYEHKIHQSFSSPSIYKKAEPQEAVEFLSTIILEKNQEKLEPYYWVGDDARIMWKARHHLPVKVADTLKTSLDFTPGRPEPKEIPIPPPNVISHVTIRVTDMKKSIPFYEAFGFKLIGDTEDRQQFLSFNPPNSRARPKSKSQWCTLVLLKEDPCMSVRGDSHEAGMTRLSILTTNLNKDVKRLESLGLKPIAATACDRRGGLMMHVYATAYKDPDGFVVYMVEFNRWIGIMIKMSLWWNNKQSHCLFHWTINMTDSIHTVIKAFESLGFITFSDLKGDRIMYDLLPAFQMESDTAEIEQIRMCHLPKDDLCVTLMQWLNPKTEKNGSELTNALTISVEDVDAALKIAKRAGLEVTSQPTEYKQLPVFGNIKVGTAYVESGSSPIQFCCFSDPY